MHTIGSSAGSGPGGVTSIMPLRPSSRLRKMLTGCSAAGVADGVSVTVQVVVHVVVHVVVRPDEDPDQQQRQSFYSQHLELQGSSWRQRRHLESKITLRQPEMERNSKI